MSTSELARKWGLHTAGTLKLRARELSASPFLIKGLLPTRSISLLVGDSGLGKSPLVYQAGLCIAAGVPFLGRETTKGRVLIADFENGVADMNELLEQLGRHLGLAEMPEDGLQLFAVNDCIPRFGFRGFDLLDIVRDYKPSLAIVDSLSSYRPDAEEKTAHAMEMLQSFRKVLRDYGTSTLLVHHRRKQPRKKDESAGPLEEANLRRWFEDARGASSLVNGSDVRLGLDESVNFAVGQEDASLALRGFGRVRGEIGPIYLARDSDEEGHVLGYRQLTGPELLCNPEQQMALAKRPESFKFKQAKEAYGRADQATSNFLQRCIDLNLVRKPGRGQYEKCPPEPAK